jgi:hypothetical protein
MQKVNSKSSAKGDRFPAEEDEFFDAVELLEDEIYPESYSRSHHINVSSGVEDDGGVGSHHGVGGDETAAASTNQALLLVNPDDNSSIDSSKIQDHARMNNNVKIESDYSAGASTETNDEGNNNVYTAIQPISTKTLTPINLHSSPYRGQIVKSIESPLEALYSIGPQGDKKLSPKFSPTRTSFVESGEDYHRSIRTPPIIDDEETANKIAGKLSLKFPGVSNSHSCSDSDSDSSIPRCETSYERDPRFWV